MAYQQNQHSQFEFDLANTNTANYDDPSLAYQKTNIQDRSLISPAPGAQMMSHGESHSQYRKDSFASNSAGVLSPGSSLPGWDAKFASRNDNHAVTITPHGFRFNDSNAFVRNDSGSYYNSNAGFLSDSNTASMFDNMTAKFEASPFPHGHEQSHQSPPSFTPIQKEANFKTTPQVLTPMSPHSQEEWKTWHELEKSGHAFPTHLRINSPPKTVDKRRGDGVRKKNAKIDIPDGRNVQVIEELMAREQDESALKELKGQKRLLRNREAAYVHC